VKNTGCEWHNEPDDEVLKNPEAKQCYDDEEYHLSANVCIGRLEGILLVREETKDEGGRTRNDVRNKLIYTKHCQQDEDTEIKHRVENTDDEEATKRLLSFYDAPREARR